MPPSFAESAKPNLEDILRREQREELPRYRVRARPSRVKPSDGAIW